MNSTTIARVMRIGADVLDGATPDPLEVAKTFVDAALDFAPVESLQAYLTEAARKRADAIADLAQAAKTGL